MQNRHPEGHRQQRDFVQVEHRPAYQRDQHDRTREREQSEGANVVKGKLLPLRHRIELHSPVEEGAQRIRQQFPSNRIHE